MTLKPFEKLELEKSITGYSKWIEQQPQFILNYQKAKTIIEDNIQRIDKSITTISKSKNFKSAIESFKFICFDSYLEKKNIFRFFINCLSWSIEAHNFSEHIQYLEDTRVEFLKYLTFVNNRIIEEKAFLELSKLKVDTIQSKLKGYETNSSEIKEYNFVQSHPGVAEKFESDFQSFLNDEFFEIQIPRILDYGLNTLFGDDDFLLTLPCNFDYECMKKEKDKFREEVDSFAINFILAKLRISADKEIPIQLHLVDVVGGIEKKLQIIYQNYCGKRFKGKMIENPALINIFTPSLRKPKRNELKSICEDITKRLELNKNEPLAAKDRTNIHKEVLKMGIYSDKESIDVVLRRLRFRTRFTN